MVRQGQQIVAIKAQHIGLDATGKGHQTHQGHHGDAFSGAGFTHNTQHFSGFDGQAHTIDGVHGGVVRWKLHRQVFDFKQCHGVLIA